MLRYANPKRFMDLSGAALPWLAGAAAIFLAAGFYLGFAAPPDYQQGDTVKIMFVHVPAAWVAMMAYGLMALSAAVGLIYRHPLADAAAKAAAPLGALFTALALITGSLWGKPMWGTWWVWDARLTSMLVLFFLYLGQITLVRAFDDPQRGNRAGAILALVGVINLPIIKFSVDWWNTLHQPASISLTGAPSMYIGMLLPLFVAAIGYSLVFAAIIVARMRAAVMERRVHGLMLARAMSEAVGDQSPSMVR